MFNLKQLHAEAIFTTVSSGMFSLHLSGKHTPSGYCPPIVYSRRSGGENASKKCTCMSQVVFLLPSREGERLMARDF